MCSPVRMRVDICARGFGEMLPGAIWCILSVPKYAIINIKINKFKDNKSTKTNIIFAIFLFNQSRCACNKQLYCIRGSGDPQKPKNCCFFFKSNKMEAFPLR